MIVLVSLVGIALIVIGIWNLISLNRLKQNSNKTNEQLNDAKYFELKYKSEFIVAVFSIIVAVVGLLGYNSINQVKKELKDYLILKSDMIDSTLTKSERKLEMNNQSLKEIESKQKIIIETLPENEITLQKQNKQIETIHNLINELNSKNKIKQEFYLVKSLKIKPNDEGRFTTEILFSELKTTNYDRLPEFKNKPFLLPIPESTATFDIYDVSLDRFKVSVSTSTNYDDKEHGYFLFSLMIIDNK